jgi:hypothetical protein
MSRRSSRSTSATLDETPDASIRDSAAALGGRTSRRRKRDEVDDPSSASASSSGASSSSGGGGRRSRRAAAAIEDAETAADDDDGNDTAAVGFFAPVPGPAIRTKHAKTLASFVKPSELAKLAAMNGELRERMQAELTRFLLFKGTVRGEPIERASIRKDCGWVGPDAAAAKDAPLNAMLAQAQTTLRGLGLDLKALPAALDDLRFGDRGGTAGKGKYGKKYFFVTQRLDRTDSGMGGAASADAATSSASSASAAAPAASAVGDFERGLLMTVLSLLYVDGGCGNTGESWAHTMTESELRKELHRLDERVSLGAGSKGRDDAIGEAGATLPELLAAFTKQLYLIKGVTNAGNEGEEAKENNYRLGPRFFLDVGERQLCRFCYTVLRKPEPADVLEGIARREELYEHEEEAAAGEGE